MKLSKSEEELMNHLWRLKKSIMKDLINAYQDPKPATTTVATLLKRMQIKKFIDYEQKGRTEWPHITTHNSLWLDLAKFG